MGAEIVKEVATKTNDVAGDGTTDSDHPHPSNRRRRHETDIDGHKCYGGARWNRSGGEGCRCGTQKSSKADKERRGNKTSRDDFSENAEIGSIIAETIKKVGKDGVVTVEESQTTTLESEVVEGIQFDKGYVSAYMITQCRAHGSRIQGASNP